MQVNFTIEIFLLSQKIKLIKRKKYFAVAFGGVKSAQPKGADWELRNFKAAALLCRTPI